MLLSAFTLFHVAVSLAAIAAGFVVVAELAHNRLSDRLINFFLATTAITSITGFLFPFHGITPGQVLGVLSLIALAVAVVARKRLATQHRLRRTYVVSLLVSLYFNVFVLVVQSFEKVPSLHVLAPTQKESPFKIAQLGVLLLFVVIGFVTVTRYRGEPERALRAANS